MITNNPKNLVTHYQNEISDELYYTITLVNAVKTCCQEKEFSNQYYCMPNNYALKVSDERNEYISMLTLISDKLANIKKLNVKTENELLLL